MCSEAGHEEGYDRLEWDYLQNNMIKLGYHRLWVEVILKMIN